MNTKQEQLKTIQEQIKTLQSTVNNLEKDIQEDEAKEERVFGFLPKAGRFESYYTMDSSDYKEGYGLLTSGEYLSHNTKQENYKGLFWKTKQEATNFTKAMNTFLELRTLEGVKGFEVGACNYTVSYCKDGFIPTKMIVYVLVNRKVNANLAPSFKTEELAHKAIETIGEERLIHMFKTLSGIV